MTPEQPTPETDFEEAAQTQRFGGYMVKANFARKLERERDAALEKLRQAEKDFYKITRSVPGGVTWFRLVQDALERRQQVKNPRCKKCGQ